MIRRWPFALSPIMLISPATLAQCGNVAWHAYVPGAYPTNTGIPRLAWDSARELMVAVIPAPNDATAVWEFNGGTWTYRHTTLFLLCDAPVAAMGPWIVTAGAGQRISGGGYNCFGGGFQTWLYSGTNWQEDTTPERKPAVRAQHAMAFHAARGAIVLFGGSNTQTSTLFNDTWEYNGNWSERSPTTSPAARVGAAMCYDPVREVIIMTAGLGATGYTRETWEYNGVTWTQRGGTQPPALSDPLFAFDERRNCAVLYSGQGPSGYNVDTWEYRNGAWTLAVDVTLGGWGDSGMAYDPEELGVMLLDPDHLGSPLMRYYGCADPHLYSHPQDRALCAGDTLYLSCGAAGIGSFSFQWRKNNVDLPGENASILIRQPASTSDAGSYTCLVTSPYGPWVLSNAGVVTVDAGDPLIFSHPSGRITCEGNDVSFSCFALGARSYQWRRGGVSIPGATSSTLTLTGVTSDDQSVYDCVISNNCGTVDTNGAALIVNEPPLVLNLSPSSVNIDAGGQVTLSATVVGTQPITRRWFRNGVPVNDGPGGASPGGGTASGASTNSLTLTGAQPADSGVYLLRAENLCDYDFGNSINLTVGGACDPDYTQDGIADQDDVAYLINVIAGGPNPTGRDPDFDANGVADQDDYAALVDVVAGGPCP